MSSLLPPLALPRGGLLFLIGDVRRALPQPQPLPFLEHLIFREAPSCWGPASGGVGPSCGQRSPLLTAGLRSHCIGQAVFRAMSVPQFPCRWTFLLLSSPPVRVRGERRKHTVHLPSSLASLLAVSVGTTVRVIDGELVPE